eukprot:577596-Rhodomonas_salina.1
MNNKTKNRAFDSASKHLACGSAHEASFERLKIRLRCRALKDRTRSLFAVGRRTPHVLVGSSGTRPCPSSHQTERTFFQDTCAAGVDDPARKGWMPMP